MIQTLYILLESLRTPFRQTRIIVVRTLRRGESLDADRCNLCIGIVFHHTDSLADLLQFGRIRVQEKGNRTIWTVSNKDRSVILMLYLQRELKPNSDEEKLFVLDADEDYDYRIFARSHILSGQEAISYPQESECYTVPGDALRWGGISLVEQVSGNGYREGMRMLGDCSSRLYIIRRIED